MQCHSASHPPIDGGQFIFGQIGAAAFGDHLQNAVDILGGLGLWRHLGHQVGIFDGDLQFLADIFRVDDKVDVAGFDGGMGHAVIACGFLALHDRNPAAGFDGPDPVGAV